MLLALGKCVPMVRDRPASSSSRPPGEQLVDLPFDVDRRRVSAPGDHAVGVDLTAPSGSPEGASAALPGMGSGICPVPVAWGRRITYLPRRPQVTFPMRSSSAS